VLATSENDTIKVNFAKRLFARYIYFKVDSAIFYATEILRMGEQMNSDAYVLTGNNYLGIANSVKGDFHQASIYMQNVLELHLENEDSINIAYSLNNLGMNHLYASEYLEATESLISSVRYKEALIVGGTSAADVDLASTLMNIGIAYQSQLDTLQAKEYYTRAIDEADKIGHDLLSARAKTSLANLLISEENFRLALTLLQGTEEVFVNQNDIFSLGKLYNNMALAYAGLNEGDKTIAFAKKAIETNKEIGNNESEGLGYVYLGLGYIKNKLFRKAIQSSNQALEKGENQGSNAILYGALKNLYEAHEALKNYEKAYEYSRRYNKVETDIFIVNRSEQIERLSAKYEADKRETEIESLSQETKLQTLELEKAAANRSLLLAFLISALLVIALVIYFYRKIKKSKNELEKINKTKDRFFAIISHDLRGHISSFQGTGRLLKHFWAKKDEEKLESITSEIDKNANNLSHLLDNLLHWSVGQLQGYQPKPEVIHVKNVIAELIETYVPLANVKGIELSAELGENDRILSDKGALHVTLRNLIANAIKFTKKGEVVIFSKSSIDHLIIGVRDTGIGIPELMLKSLFEIGEEKIREGTQNERGTGLGLNLAYEFTKLNGGRLEVESKEGIGTTFLLYLKHA